MQIEGVIMSHNLVVTAMGVDRPGIVSTLARLATECDCDIVDSRMAIFGNEFTLILMLSGSWAAITKIENNLPALSVELELLTIMKRTSTHTPQNYVSRVEVVFKGLDKRGTINKITSFLAQRSLDLAAVRSHSGLDENQQPFQRIFLAINVPDRVDLDSLENTINELSAELELTSTIKRMQSMTTL